MFVVKKNENVIWYVSFFLFCIFSLAVPMGHCYCKEERLLYLVFSIVQLLWEGKGVAKCKAL